MYLIKKMVSMGNYRHQRHPCAVISHQSIIIIWAIQAQKLSFHAEDINTHSFPHIAHTCIFPPSPFPNIINHFISYLYSRSSTNSTSLGFLFLIPCFAFEPDVSSQVTGLRIITESLERERERFVFHPFSSRAANLARCLIFTTTPTSLYGFKPAIPLFPSLPISPKIPRGLFLEPTSHEQTCTILDPPFIPLARSFLLSPPFSNLDFQRAHP